MTFPVSCVARPTSSTKRSYSKMAFTVRILWEERNEIFSLSVKRNNAVSDLESFIRSNRKAKKLLTSSDKILFSLDKERLQKSKHINDYNIKYSTTIVMSVVSHRADDAPPVAHLSVTKDSKHTRKTIETITDLVFLYIRSQYITFTNSWERYCTPEHAKAYQKLASGK